MPITVRGPSQALRKPATGAVGVVRARHFHGDPTVGRRLERAGGHVRSPVTRQPVRNFNTLRDVFERYLLQISAVLFFLGTVGWCWLIFNEFRASWSAPAGSTYTASAKPDAGVGKSDEVGSSAYERIDGPLAVAAPYPSLLGTETPASVVAREWGRLERMPESGRALTKQIAKAPSLKPPLRMASLERTAPITAPLRPSLNTGAVTTMVDFATAPFPYHGAMPGSDRPFLNVAENGRLGHTNFRGHIFWESGTFSDDRVLLHIPPGFDPRRPAVMVVFFHGHGADLARDVRDRQRLPEQITASGANAVLVAPQFAFDAADSSSGKFWEPNGFKHFLDEAAVKLAKLYGDPRSAFTFAKMPIVIVAYSGGFGPTLSVLDRGGVGSRVRGLVLLDALYAGIDKFADWIARNRSTFFVSSYTPHTAYHNADLERLLRERSVPYDSDLRRNHLQGMVAFLPTGDISHRDFVTHAWAGNPVSDILSRMDDVDSKVLTARTASPLHTGSIAAARN
ncbi:MAG TPA: hypothetical protein VMV19_04265 [Xanthobacteraceae bacterium]|nr:hypothetical protein [Xanthobacteraceae bacterium]